MRSAGCLTHAAGLLVAAQVLAVAGCGGTDPNPGITAYLRAANAQFIPGPLTVDAAAMSPSIFGINIANTNIRPGLQGLGLSGTVEGGATVLIGLADDSGHWIVPAAIADTQAPNSYTFQTQLSFSPTLPATRNDDGSHRMETLIMRGVAPDGTVGPSQSLPLMVMDALPEVTGAFVISLVWDTNADLDLHLVMPNPLQDPAMESKPIEIWSRSPLGLPPNPSGYLEDDQAWKDAGKLDFDSNENCIIDGRRQENIVFGAAPPPGEYIVRVDTFSMCGQGAAQWKVTVSTPDGPYLNAATWQSTEVDTRGSHGAGAGRLAVQFSL